MTLDRREALSAALGAVSMTALAAASPASARAAGMAQGTAGVVAATTPPPAYRRGFDGQRVADLGDGCFLNPLMAGDHPDPSIMRDGKDYYMTFSTL